MRGERLFRILGLLDDDLIEEAVPASSAAASRRRPSLRRFLGAAACLALICGLGLWLRSGGGMNSGGGADGMSPGAGSGGSGHGEGTVFMSYAGPVFPLAALEGDAGLTAERTLTWDFAPGSYPDGEPRQWGAEVEDRYVLANPTGEDVTITALYPFAGDFDSLAGIRPTVSVDGAEVPAELYSGPYAGGFSCA